MYLIRIEIFRQVFINVVLLSLLFPFGLKGKQKTKKYAVMKRMISLKDHRM